MFTHQVWGGFYGNGDTMIRLLVEVNVGWWWRRLFLPSFVIFISLGVLLLCLRVWRFRVIYA